MDTDRVRIDGEATDLIAVGEESAPPDPHALGGATS